MIYVRDDIPIKLLTKRFSVDIKCIFLELNFRKSKWFLVGACITHLHRIIFFFFFFFESLDKAIDVYSPYEKVLLLGDFNAEISEVCSDSFLYPHELKNVVSQNFVLKTFRILVAFLLFLTNNALSFQHTETVSSSLSDFHIS